MTLIDIAPKSPFAEPVQDALPVRLPSGLKATEVLGTLEDPREHAKGPQDVVLRLREECGANIVQVTDAFGRLHRTDGPALVRVTPAGRMTKQWWVEGRRIDDASGPSVQLTQFTQFPAWGGPALYDDEMEVLNNHLPAAFRVSPDGSLRGPIGAAGAIVDSDYDDIAIAADGDPIVAVAEEIRRKLVTTTFRTEQAARPAA
ncbi:hypothetical protein [Pseudactinotalea sp. Z1748]|uniref:hypothetical protein n=1 Tax=Pseudactinotalea sp. Z1748 TaxID=3413027 RepID=UPI003C7BDE9A